MNLNKTINKLLAILVSPKFNALDTLNELRLRPLMFVTPTVDGDTFLNLRTLGGDWSDRLAHSAVITPVKQAIDKMVVTSTEEVSNYEFKNIQSIRAGKSLMGGSASKYQNVLEWGNNMYSDDKIGFETDVEFSKNLSHVNQRFIDEDKGLKLEVYDWHRGRNNVNNHDCQRQSKTDPLYC